MCIRDSFDIAALPRYNLAGQIQANAHALLFVYFCLTIKSPEDGGLIAFGNALDVYKRQVRLCAVILFQVDSL